MDFIDSCALFCNVGVLLANLLGFAVVAFGVYRSPRFVGFWCLLLAFPPAIVLTGINLLTLFGRNTLSSILPKEVFRILYPTAMIVAPVGATLYLVGLILVVRNVTRT